MKKVLLFIALIMIHANINAQWNQLGNDIDGEMEWDNSGYSVSMSDDGLIVAIGANRNDGGFYDAGHVRVYGYVDGEWEQMGEDINGADEVNEFGIGVSLSADGMTLAAGATGNDGGGLDAGHVRVFRYVSGDWEQIGGDIEGESSGDASGLSVSLNSDGIIVGIGSYLASDAGTYSGQARVFKLVSGIWSQLGESINGEEAGDFCGYAVALSGDGLTFAVGAHGNDESGTNAGHVRVYKFESEEWIQIGVDLDAVSDHESYGFSVDINETGNILAVGAPTNSEGGVYAGQVQMYELVSGEWEPLGGSINGEFANDHCGQSVSLNNDGHVVAIGSHFNSELGGFFGHTRVFELVEDDWMQIGEDINGEATDDYSGNSVSLSASGKIVAIGALQNDGGGLNAGHVRVYTSCISDTTIQEAITCGEYLWIDGNSYFESTDLPLFTLMDEEGCDSVINLNLTINDVDISTSVVGLTLSANAEDAIYQWLDCDNDYEIIDEEVSKDFIPEVNGNYAVMVTEDGCTDTSECIAISMIGHDEYTIQSFFTIYPNPSDDDIRINFRTNLVGNHTIFIHDILGQEVYRNENITGQSLEIKKEQLGVGVYILSVINTNSEELFSSKLIVE
mgnify:CR=1 FL=1